MKSNDFFLSAFFAVILIFSACSKEDDQITTIPERIHEGVYEGQKFYLEIDGIEDDINDNTKLSINSAWSKVLFDENDIVYINNVQYRIYYLDDQNRWCASRMSGTDSIDGETFVCYYFGPNVTKSGSIVTFAQSYSSPNHLSEIDSVTGNPVTYSLTYHHSSIVLAGVTHDSIITLRPACALIRFHGDAITSNLRIGVGFAEDVAIKKGSITPVENNSPNVSSATAMGKVQKVSGFGGKITVKGDMLVATNDYTEGEDYYVAIPVNSAATFPTTLFLEVYDGEDFYYDKVTGVTLSSGQVYTINIE